MRSWLFAALFALAGCAAAQAQSTITLDSFGLDVEEDGAAPTPQPQGEMAQCLLDQANCDNAKYKGATQLSIDDVVNLQIVDHEDIDENAAGVNQAPGNTASPTLPTLDIEILFDYDSDTVRADQGGKLNELIGLMNDPAFSGFRFGIIGHTDAKGDPAYNRDLSYRRAASVVSYIASYGGIATSRLVARGLGADQLKAPADPFGAINRRVQLVAIPVKQ